MSARKPPTPAPEPFVLAIFYSLIIFASDSVCVVGVLVFLIMITVMACIIITATITTTTTTIFIVTIRYSAISSAVSDFKRNSSR